MTLLLPLHCLASLGAFLYVLPSERTRDARIRRQAELAHEREVRRDWQPTGFDISALGKRVREAHDAELAHARRRQTGRHAEWVRAVRNAIRRSSYFEDAGVNSEMK